MIDPPVITALLPLRVLYDTAILLGNVQCQIIIIYYYPRFYFSNVKILDNGTITLMGNLWFHSI